MPNLKIHVELHNNSRDWRRQHAMSGAPMHNGAAPFRNRVARIESSWCFVSLVPSSAANQILLARSDSRNAPLARAHGATRSCVAR